MYSTLVHTRSQLQPIPWRVKNPPQPYVCTCVEWETSRWVENTCVESNSSQPYVCTFVESEKIAPRALRRVIVRMGILKAFYLRLKLVVKSTVVKNKPKRIVS